MSTTTSAQPAQLTRNERLDRLPFNKAHRKLLVASGIGWAFDAMDVGLVSFVVAAIAADPHFNLTPTEKSWVLSIGFVGMAIGAAVGGFIADRVGRKTVFTATLLGLAAQHPGKTRLLVPCADGYTRLLACHADALRGAYRFACPPPEAVEALSDKQRFAAACRAAGLRTPQTVVFCPGGTVPDLPFGWPVIVKPADSDAWARCRFPGKRKVYLAGGAAALRTVLDAVCRSSYCGAMLLQEYIPGPDTCLGVVNAYCARDGSVPWLVQGQPLLQERTPEGTGNYAAVLVEPARQDTALLDTLRGLLQAAGWRGYANFDLKYDRSGTPVLFELNPRPGRASFYCDAAGAPLARPLVEDLLCRGPVTPPKLRPAVWHTAPWCVVRRHCPSRLLLHRAALLRRRGRASAHLLAAGEGAPRRIWFVMRQCGYARKLQGQRKRLEKG